MKIMFICTGNTCRSPMGEGILRHLLEQSGRTDIVVGSAGLAAFPGDEASPHAIEACREIGVDLTHHRSRRLNADDLQQTDLFVPMTPAHAAALQQQGIDAQRIFLPLDPIRDPFGGTLAVYQACRDDLVQLCKQVLKQVDERDKV